MKPDTFSGPTFSGPGNLDGTWGPDGSTYYPGRKLPLVAPIKSVVLASSFASGDQAFMWDAPSTAWTPGLQSLDEDDSFKTYILFKPGGFAEWVSVEVTSWSATAHTTDGVSAFPALSTPPSKASSCLPPQWAYFWATTGWYWKPGA